MNDIALAAVIALAAAYIVVVVIALDAVPSSISRIAGGLHERIAAGWNRNIARHHRVSDRDRDMGDDDRQKG